MKMLTEMTILIIITGTGVHVATQVFAISTLDTAGGGQAQFC